MISHQPSCQPSVKTLFISQHILGLRQTKVHIIMKWSFGREGRGWRCFDSILHLVIQSAIGKSANVEQSEDGTLGEVKGALPAALAIEALLFLFNSLLFSSHQHQHHHRTHITRTHRTGILLVSYFHQGQGRRTGRFSISFTISFFGNAFVIDRFTTDPRRCSA